MSDDAATDASRPRYSAAQLPPYSYVPGFTPHPVSDPRGHMHGRRHEPAAALDPNAWRDSAAYLFAADLFNYGFYWEAHEVWESLWHAVGRVGPTANWLKALIKLAAAGVKAREGNPRGVERHCRRAIELVAEVRAHLPPAAIRFGGMALQSVVDAVAALAADAAQSFSQPQPQLLLKQWLQLGEP